MIISNSITETEKDINSVEKKTAEIADWRTR